nr:adhesion G-protein coupled receptor D1-like [Lytechinus pictus]
MNARVSFESQDQNEVVGGATDVIQDGIDSSGNLLHVVSLVMSIDIEDGNSTLDLNGSVIIDFAVNLTGSSNILYCAFIANESSGVWSSSGMEVVLANSTLVRCRSNHLTSFAVLLSAKPPKGLNAVIQSHLSRIMGSLSVLCLTLALFIYVATGTWKQLKIQIHINLAVSTALGQLLFMTMAEMTWNRIVCKTIAVTLQYLFTSALAWTMIEGVFLYRTTAVGFKPLRIGWLSLFAWGGSLVVVGVSFGVLYDGYGSTSYCWLRHDDHTIYVFVGCVFAVLLFNSMILFFVMKSFMALKANAKKDELDKFKAMTRAMLILLPILGLTWFAGAITSITKSDHVIFFQYIFIISFGMQGICILIFHCLQVPAIKAVLKNRIHRRVKDSSWTSKSGAQRSTTVTSTF